MKILIVSLWLYFFSVAVFASLPGTVPDLDLCARYTVWLKKGHQDLAAFNHYFIKNYHIDRSVEGHERMIFSLPTDLTAGEKIEMTLAVVFHNGAAREFDGPAGKATCDGPWKKMTCNFKFNPISVDQAASAEFLTKKYGDTLKRDALVEIAMRFGGEPIGVAVMAPRDARCFQP